ADAQTCPSFPVRGVARPARPAHLTVTTEPTGERRKAPLQLHGPEPPTPWCRPAAGGGNINPRNPPRPPRPPRRAAAKSPRQSEGGWTERGTGESSATVSSTVGRVGGTGRHPVTTAAARPGAARVAGTGPAAGRASRPARTRGTVRLRGGTATRPSAAPRRCT